MRSADECLAKAKQLSGAAERQPSLAFEYLTLAEQWLDLACKAERQDQFNEQDILSTAVVKRFAWLVPVST